MKSVAILYLSVQFANLICVFFLKKKRKELKKSNIEA